eukprot:CAMPEP_0184485950 /NCGR_PEP_ID=MMETSP0113_2-20130426/7518_1 /TAXON_ID=91329 /ORGANISM="Norrisiella sphaerica, Strain BC52" /LENGTH=176 /DNA_ID=CAMNT_0026867619 /DNA_START=159 /DNA_END=686 /DNA_ORIENTATION=+
MEATSRKILTHVFKPGDRWFRTGDLLKRDSCGYYYFVDRLGDTFRWKGENVATTEVASVFLSCRHPRIVEATVYGIQVPHYDGRAGMVCIKMSADGGENAREDARDQSLSKLLNHCSEHLPSYAIPVFLRIRSDGKEMDLTSTFKLRKINFQREGIAPERISGDEIRILCRLKRTW